MSGPVRVVFLVLEPVVGIGEIRAPTYFQKFSPTRMWSRPERNRGAMGRPVKWPRRAVVWNRMGRVEINELVSHF